MTVIVQEPPGATEPQPFECLKWDELEPQRLADVTVRLAVPVFETATVFDMELLLAIVPKLMEVGETEILGSPLVAAACVTVKVWPAMARVPVLAEAVAFGPTE